MVSFVANPNTPKYKLQEKLSRLSSSFLYLTANAFKSLLVKVEKLIRGEDPSNDK
jgi:hypothetical protein